LAPRVYGLAAAVEIAFNMIRLDLKGARVAVQGFGAVGKHAARFLSQKGCVLVACSDSSGTVSSPNGLDVSALISLKSTAKHVTDFACGDKAGTEAIIDVPCDIWIPAARPDVLNKENAGRLNARIVAQGANIPCTPEAKAILESRGILVLPDLVVNAGGVICATTEYHGGNEGSAFAAIDDKIRTNTMAVIQESRRSGTPNTRRSDRVGDDQNPQRGTRAQVAIKNASCTTCVRRTWRRGPGKAYPDRKPS